MYTYRADVAAYYVNRTASGPVCCNVKLWNGEADRVKHLVRHSPTGFEYGYLGSGPADLARSIIGHFLSLDDPPPLIYQPFKEEFIAPEQGLEFTIFATEIVAWLKKNVDVNLVPAEGEGAK